MSIENFLNETIRALDENTAAVKLLSAAMNPGTNTQTSTPNATAAVATPGAAVAPAAQAPATSTPANGMTDINAMPWDERIHTTAQDTTTGQPKKTSKGVWQKRRGVTKETIAVVEAELMDGVQGAAAISSTPADLATNTPAVGIPGAPIITAPTQAPVVPLVLPVPADTTLATMQDCVNIVQVFSQLHGVEMTAGHLKLWNMADISQLPESYFTQFINYMVEQHDQLVAASA